MLFSRRVVLSCKQAANLLQRSGQSKRIQSLNYCNSSRQYNGRKPDFTQSQSLPIGSQASSQIPYAIPAVVLGFAGFIAFLHYNDERRAVPKGQASSNNSSNTTGKGPIIGGPFTLISTQNKIITEQDFRGNWILLYFGYSFSPDVGPEQLKIITNSLHKLESNHNQKILPVFVTLDPQRDTPSHLNTYLKEFDGRILGLTGAASAIRQMAQEYRVYFKKVEEDREDYLVDTSHNMYLLNPKMEVVRCFGVEYNSDELSREVLKEVRSFTH